MPPRKKTTRPAAKEMMYRVTLQSQDIGHGDTPICGGYGGIVFYSVLAKNRKEAAGKALRMLAQTSGEARSRLRCYDAFPDIIHIELALHQYSIDTFVDQYEKDHPEVFEE